MVTAEELRAALERAHEGDPAALIEAIPYAEFLGLNVVLDGDEILGHMRFSEHLIGNSLIPALHGGTIGAMMEWTAIMTVIMRSDVLRVPKTINITTEYLRTGRPEDVWARAELTKLGRRVANVRCFAWQSERDRPIAAANVHVLLA